MRTVLWLLLACFCGAAGFILEHRPPPISSPPAVAHVNGRAITGQELEQQLRSFRPQALEQLVRLRLLEGEAARLQISLETNEDRAQALIEAIILKEAGPGELAQVYQTCREELARYDCSVMLFNDEESESAVLDKLAQGSDFAQLAHSYSQDRLSRAQGGRIGWVTLPELKARYGPYVAEEAGLLSLNKLSGPVPAPYGSMIVLVHARRASFEDLREDCKKVLIEARTTALLARLTTKAVIGP